MTPTYDQATLFLAPLSPRGSERTDRTQTTVDHRAEAMSALRHPFAVRTEPAAVSAR